MRKRFRQGVRYNMKVVVRGARATGKSSLVSRLRGFQCPRQYHPTAEIRACTVNWEPRGDPDAVLDTVKVEVWDVVDNGIQRDDAALSEADFDAQGERLAGLAKKRTGKLDRLNKTGRSSKTKTGWHATKQQRGSLTVGCLDASTVDVYRDAHAVVVMLDPTRSETLEYAERTICDAPPNLPVLVLCNFRDICDKRRTVPAEAVHALSRARECTTSAGHSEAGNHVPATSAPIHILEASMTSCYGLEELYEYLNVPFLLMKQRTLQKLMDNNAVKLTQAAALASARSAQVLRDALAVRVGGEGAFEAFMHARPGAGQNAPSTTLSTASSRNGAGADTDAVSCTRSGSLQVLDTPTEKHESRGKKNEQERDDDENKDEEEPKQEEDQQPDREEESADDEDKGKDDDNEEDECKHDDEGVGVDRVGSGNNEPGENEDGHAANGGDSDEAAKRDQTAKPVQESNAKSIGKTQQQHQKHQSHDDEVTDATPGQRRWDNSSLKHNANATGGDSNPIVTTSAARPVSQLQHQQMTQAAAAPVDERELCDTNASMCASNFAHVSNADGDITIYPERKNAANAKKSKKEKKAKQAKKPKKTKKSKKANAETAPDQKSASEINRAAATAAANGVDTEVLKFQLPPPPSAFEFDGGLSSSYANAVERQWLQQAQSQQADRPVTLEEAELFDTDSFSPTNARAASEAAALEAFLGSESDEDDSACQAERERAAERTKIAQYRLQPTGCGDASDVDSGSSTSSSSDSDSNAGAPRSLRAFTYSCSSSSSDGDSDSGSGSDGHDVDTGEGDSLGTDGVDL
eukprot:g906.t1